MHKQLQAVRDRYDELGQLLQQPDVVSDQARLRALMKEYKSLAPVADAYDALCGAERTCSEARAILDEPGADRELRELAQAEYDAARAKQQAMEQQLRLLLLPKDENDERSVIMEIRSGAGGAGPAARAGGDSDRPGCAVCAGGAADRRQPAALSGGLD